MRLFGVLAAVGLVMDVPDIVSASTPPIPLKVDKQSQESVRNDGKSPLLADCVETDIVPSRPHPLLHRASFAAKPRHHHARPKKRAKRRPAKHHVTAKHHVKAKHHARHGKHKVTHRRKTYPRHYPVILHRVTFANPLCAKRSPVLNHMLGLPDQEAAPLIAEDTGPDTAGILPPYIDLAPIGVGYAPGPGPGPGPFPYTPIYPVGPGPIIIFPPPPPPPPVGPGCLPGGCGPVNPPPPPPPPVTPPSVPEPSSWAMMLLGMALVGGARRRMGKAAIQ